MGTADEPLVGYLTDSGPSAHKAWTGDLISSQGLAALGFPWLSTKR